MATAFVFDFDPVRLVDTLTAERQVPLGAQTSKIMLRDDGDFERLEQAVVVERRRRSLAQLRNQREALDKEIRAKSELAHQIAEHSIQVRQELYDLHTKAHEVDANLALLSPTDQEVTP